MEQKAFFIADAKRLKKETEKPHRLARQLSKAHEELRREMPRVKPLDQGEYWSWVYSLPEFADLLIKAGLNEDHKVLVEGILQIRESLRRIDVILCGQQTDSIPSMMLWELKRWNDSNGFSVRRSREQERMIEITKDGDLYRAEEHPAVKVGKARNVIVTRLREALKLEGDQIGARAFVYFDQQKTNFNQEWKYELYAQQYKRQVAGTFPKLITRNNTVGVEDALRKFIGKGDGGALCDTMTDQVLGYESKEEIADAE